jgi:hypothetical protein
LILIRALAVSAMRFFKTYVFGFAATRFRLPRTCVIQDKGQH